MLLELTAIVSLDVFNPAVKEMVEPVHEVSRRHGAVGRIHASKCQFGVLVDGGHNIPFLASVVPNHGIQAHQEAPYLFVFQIRDLLAFD